MKVIVVFLLFFVVINFELGVACKCEEDLKNDPDMLEGMNKLDVHYMHNCAPDRKNNAEVIEAWMGPCKNTPTCKSPMCCGIVCGQDSLFAIKYRAKIPFKGGVFNGNIGGIALGNATRGAGPMLEIGTPFGQLLFPPTLAGYKRTLSTQTTCPQRKGDVHTLCIPFRFVTKFISSLGIKANFVAEIVTNDCPKKVALCWGLYAELVCPCMVESLLKPLTCAISDVKNPTKLLRNLQSNFIDVFKGIFDNYPWKSPVPLCDFPQCAMLENY